MKIASLKYWFPILPFILYWPVSLMLYIFGPFENDPIGIGTISYVIGSLLLFTTAYYYAISCININKNYYSYEGLALKRYRIFLIFTFIGTLLFVLDKSLNGGGNLDAVVNEFDKLRSDYNQNTSLITTLGVVPQSFKLLAMGAVFYLIKIGYRLKLFDKFLIFAILLLEIMNMVLTASRGAIVWDALFFLYYLIAVKEIKFKTIGFRKALITAIIMVVAAVTVYLYASWVAVNRVESATAIYEGQQAYFKLKDTHEFDGDYGRLASYYQLYFYVTHGFNVVDKIIEDAPLVNFDIISSLGIRFKNQIQRFIPGYISDSELAMVDSYKKHNLNESLWMSIFGGGAYYFGVIGFIILMPIAGFFCGYVAKNYFQKNSLPYTILLLSVFSMTLSTFNWPIRDFDVFFAIIYALSLKK